MPFDPQILQETTLNHSKTQTGRRAVTKTLIDRTVLSHSCDGCSRHMGADRAYPDKPIKWVVPVPAGGGMDAVTRIVSAGMATALNQPIVVDNRAGAAGTIGTGLRRPVRAGRLHRLDDRQLDLHDRASGFQQAAPMPAPKDLKLVATLVRIPLVLAVPGDSPSKTFQDFIQSSKANPGKISYGSPGVGSPLHVGMELLQTRTGTKMLHVPYRGMEQHPDGPVDWNDRGRVGRLRLREILRRVRTDQDPRSRHGEAAVPTACRAHPR